MKEIEVTGTIDKDGRLSLQERLPLTVGSSVQVIVRYSEDATHNPDDTPVEEIKASLKQAWKEAQLGETIPLSQMWDGIDV